MSFCDEMLSPRTLALADRGEFIRSAERIGQGILGAGACQWSRQPSTDGTDGGRG